jgi:hypothetical protein
MNTPSPASSPSSETDLKKSILIQGKNNRYHMRKILDGKDVATSPRNFTACGRVDSYNKDLCKQEIQRDIIRCISKKISNDDYNMPVQYNEIAFKVNEHLRTKLSSYKMQDKIKKRAVRDTPYCNVVDIVNMLCACNLICHYCKNDVVILYESSGSREMTQWTLDRLDNDLPHIRDNVVISCLECNLNKRRRSEKDFVFTKQLAIIKQEDTIMQDVMNRDQYYEEMTDYGIFNPEDIRSNIEYSHDT